MSKRYNNYHRHDHYSNLRTPDVIVKPIDYIDRIKELGHTSYFTTNHGCSGSVFEAYELCQKNSLSCIYGMEMYYADDRHDKTERKNYHIIVIGLTKNAFYEINRISSEANQTGFYYHPRIDLELLLTLPKDEVVITTACIGGRLFKTEDYENEFVLPLKEYFGNNFMLEVQSHNHPSQVEWNEKVLWLSKKYGIPIIHGNDSHYIYPEQSKDRNDFLRGKGMNYGDEDSFILDYPDYDIILDRYAEQGVLTKEQSEEALNNTLVFDKAIDLEFTREKKIPNVHGDGDKNKQLKKIIANRWNVMKNNIDESKHVKYRDAILNEVDIVVKTDMADYFLLNEKIIDKAVNEYGAILSRTGRGSATSFIINNLLNFTEIDRVDAKVPLYPTRFMSVSRILESGQIPDIDFNFSSVEPVIQASKDILGEDNIYYMSAYGTMQESGAFRNLCRAKGLPPESYNDVAKNLENHINDVTWKDLIEDSKKFIGVIDSISPSPCSFIMLDKPISTNIGLIRVGNELCASIDGYTADSWGYLKNDYLTVDVWKIISETFKMVGKEIPSIKELDGLLNDKVWKLYEDGITKTINQVDSDFAIMLIKDYKPKSIEELSAFVASIRPGFASLLDNFIKRKPHSTEVKELDNLLEDSFHYLLYQESLMQMFVWCGIPEEQTYDVIKKIAKKKFDKNELEIFKQTLRKGFIKQANNDDKFDDIWQVVEDSVQYAFNASHSYSMAYDSAYGAYLKSHYPLEYYTVVLNHYNGSIKRTSEIANELGYFNIKLNDIKFGYSDANYNLDKDTNSIYKGISSIKYLNVKVADELYTLSQSNMYTSFIHLLKDVIMNTSTDARQLKILTSLNFFSEFGCNKKLLLFTKYFTLLNNKKQFSQSKLYNNKFDEISIEKDEKTIKKKIHLEMSQYKLLFENNSRQTEKMYVDLDIDVILQGIWESLNEEKLPLKEQLRTELEYLGYIEFKEPKASDNLYFISEYKLYKNPSNPYVELYNIKDGTYIRTKCNSTKDYDINPFKLNSVIRVNEWITKNKVKYINGKRHELDETHDLLKSWDVVQK